MLALLRKNRDFRAVFAAQVISYMGDWFASVAMLGLVLDLTHSDLAATLVFVSQTLPAFLMTPLAGPTADRFDRRAVMVTVSVVQIGAALLFLAVGHHTVWLAFLAQGSISALSAFFQPASQAALPNLVEPEDLATATVMMSATWGAMLAIGAALGGLFTVLFGRTASFLADAASFAVAAALITSVRRRMGGLGREERGRSRMRPLADTAEALRYARRHPALLALLGSKMGFGLSGGVVGLLAVFATKKFHAGDAGTGVLLAARGAGVVLGPLLARRIADRGVDGIILACGLAGVVYGAGYAIVPLAPLLALAAIAVFAAHLGGGAQWTLSTYGLQVSTPDELRGRIFASDFALVTLTLTVSFVAAGALSTQFGPGPVTFGLAGISALWGVAYLTLTRAVRADAIALGAPVD
ncbi:MAG: hypothetical protein QOG64_409 [Acidimicrobiaceae bacterium]|nr:hypothetical protein [Acidimicrobiaceae bacterium]